MKHYRSLVRFLRRHFDEYRLEIRRVAIGQDYGRCNLVGGRFVITLDRELCEGGACLCLLHEMAHVLSWHRDKAPSQHGPEFGLAYHRVWEAYLIYLGRSAQRKGTMAAAGKKVARPSPRPRGCDGAAGTIGHVTGIRQLALADAAKHAHKKLSHMERLAEVAPEVAAELRQLLADWHAGDEQLRRAYPSGASLGRFIAGLDLPVKFSTATIKGYLAQLGQ